MIMNNKKNSVIPLNKKLMRSFLKIVIIPMTVLSIISFSLSLYTIAGNSLFAFRSINQQILLNVQNMIDATSAIMNYAVLDSDLKDILDKDYSELGGKEFLEKFYDETYITNTLLRIYHMNDAINSVVIVPENTDNIYFAGVIPTVKDYGFKQEEWYGDILKGNGRLVVSGTHTNYLVSTNPSCITIGRCIIDPMKNDKLLGVMMVNITEEKLAALWKNNQITTNSFSILLDSSGHVIKQSDTVFADNELLKAVDLLSDNEFTVSISKIKGKAFIILSSYSGSLGWKVISYMPIYELFSTGETLLFVLLVIVTFLCIVLFIISKQISKKITGPVEKLNQTIREIEKGNFDIQAEEGMDEVGNLAKSINHMTADIKNYIIRIQSEEREKRNLELLALQSQINPHFLYNTLNSIKTAATLQGADRLAQVLDSLVKFLRFCSKANDDLIPLENELDMVLKFIDIMNFRYFSKINLKLDIPEDLKKYTTVRFIMQPIIENSIIHGFDFSQKQANILIRIFEKEGQLVIQIADNGRGIKPERLQTINEELQKGTESSTDKIGLANINKRIKLILGKQYGLSLKSKYGCYTAVEIKLPK